MMWIKGDRTECRTDITELEWTDNNTTKTPLLVATRDAKQICNELNVLMIIHDLFKTEKRVWCDRINNSDSNEVISSAEIYLGYLDYLEKRYNDALSESIENGVLLK